MTIDLSDVRVTHGSAEAAAGSEATARAGVHRDIRHIDHAIEDALEALHADTGNRLDTSHDQDWEHIEGHMLALLDLTPTEWAAWAAYEATA